MEKAVFQDMILNELNQLPLDMQRKVLDFLRSINNSSLKGINGPELLKFADLFTPEESKELSEIIEKDCEGIDFSEW